MTHTFKHPKFYAELRRERRAQASKLTSSRDEERKPSSPGPRGQASSPRNSVPGSGIQGTSDSVQASGNKQQE